MNLLTKCAASAVLALMITLAFGTSAFAEDGVPGETVIVDGNRNDQGGSDTETHTEQDPSLDIAKPLRTGTPTQPNGGYGGANPNQGDDVSNPDDCDGGNGDPQACCTDAYNACISAAYARYNADLNFCNGEKEYGVDCNIMPASEARLNRRIERCTNDYQECL